MRSARSTTGRDGLRHPSFLPTSVFVVSAAVLGAASSVWNVVGIGASVGIVVALAASILRLSTVQAVVVAAPIMFFPPIGSLIHVAVSDLVLPFLVLSLVVHRRDRTEVRSSTTERALLLSVALAVLFAAFVNSFDDPLYRVDLAVLDLFKLTVVLAYLVAFYLALERLSLAQIWCLIALWTWVATALALGSIVSLLPSDGYRSLGFFQDPNLYAGYLLLSLTLLILRAVERRSRFWLVSAAIICLGVVTTASRGAMAALLVLMLAAVLLLARTSVRRYAVAALVAGALLLLSGVLQRGGFPLPGVERLNAASAATGDDPRLRLWSAAIDLFLDHPLSGVGLGQYPRFSVGLSEFDGHGLGQVAHNSFLSVLAEFGLLGAVPLFAGFAFLILQALRTRRINRGVGSSLLLGYLAVALMMLSLNLQNLRYVWLFFAVALVLGRRLAQTEPDAAEIAAGVAVPSSRVGRGSGPHRSAAAGRR